MIKNIYTFVFSLVFLSSNYAQTIEKQIYIRSLAITELGYANDDNITLKVFKQYDIGQTDTLNFAIITIKNTSLSRQAFDYNQRRDQIIYNYSQETSQAQLRLYKQDILKLLTCLNEIVPHGIRNNKSSSSIYCKTENLTIGHGDVRNRFSLHIDGEAIYLKKSKMLNFVAAVKKIEKMVSLDPEREKQESFK
jgi:hypothetical protein